MKFLSKPFPIEVDLKTDLKIVVMVTIFPPLFIAIFQPIEIFSGFDQSIIKSWVILCGFGVLSGFFTLFIGILLPMRFPRFFEKATILTAICYYVLFILIVATANYAYKAFWEKAPIFDVLEYLNVIKYTFLIGIFPLVLILILSAQSRLKKNLAAALEINKQIHHEEDEEPAITLSGEAAKQVLRLSKDSFLYAESADNYVTVYYQGNDGIQKELLRSSMKSLEQQMQQVSGFTRVHRSYIVNLHQVVKAEGNSRGLELTLRDQEHAIPVSRKYVNLVTALMKSI